MDIHLNNAHRETVRLFLDGVLHGELSVGMFDGRDTLYTEVYQARCLRVLVTLLQDLVTAADAVDQSADPVHLTPVSRQAAFLRGLRDGLAGRTVPHVLTGVPPMPPEQALVYDRGYYEGIGLRGVLAQYAQDQQAHREGET